MHRRQPPVCRKSCPLVVTLPTLPSLSLWHSAAQLLQGKALVASRRLWVDSIDKFKSFTYEL